MAVNVLRRFSSLSYFTRNCKWYSSSNVPDAADPIVITDDGSTIVCWHPTKPFPYELSQPIPASPTPEDSVLKVQSSKELYSLLKPKNEEVVRQELMSMTYTTKHRWFPNNRRLKQKKRPALPRRFL